MGELHEASGGLAPGPGSGGSGCDIRGSSPTPGAATKSDRAECVRQSPICHDAVAAEMRHRTLVVAYLPRPATEDDDGRWVEKADEAA